MLITMPRGSIKSHRACEHVYIIQNKKLRYNRKQGQRIQCTNTLTEGAQFCLVILKGFIYFPWELWKFTCSRPVSSIRGGWPFIYYESVVRTYFRLCIWTYIKFVRRIFNFEYLEDLLRGLDKTFYKLRETLLYMREHNLPKRWLSQQWASECIYPTPPSRVGCDIRSVFHAEFNRFEFRIFLLRDRLPYRY